jgi:hypothetical protein
MNLYDRNPYQIDAPFNSYKIISRQPRESGRIGEFHNCRLARPSFLRSEKWRASIKQTS